MTPTEEFPEQTLEWLRSHEGEGETPDEIVRDLLRGPEPTAETPLVPPNDHVTDAFLEWVRSQGTEEETPDETIRKMRRGPKPTRHAIDSPPAERPHDP